MAAPLEAPAPRRSWLPAWARRRGVIAAGLAALLVIVGATAGLVVRLRQPAPGTRAALVQAVEGDGLTCGHLDQIHDADVWGCVGDTSPSYQMVMAEYDRGGRLVYLDAVVDRQSMDGRRFDTKGQAKALFTAAVNASFTSDRAGQVMGWASRRIGTERTTTTIADLHMTMESDRAPDDAILKVRRGSTVPADTVVPLPHASSRTALPYFRSRGYSCSPQAAGSVECDIEKAHLLGTATLWPVSRTTALSEIGLGLSAGDVQKGGDVRPQIQAQFPAVLGMVFQGDSAHQASTWVLGHLGKEAHMTLIDGILVQLEPGYPDMWGRTGIHSEKLTVTTMTWV